MGIGFWVYEGGVSAGRSFRLSSAAGNSLGVVLGSLVSLRALAALFATRLHWNYII